MEESLDETAVVGFIHNISPLKTGRSFEFHVQTKQKTIRGVCFNSTKRKLMNDFSEQGSPVKITKFQIDRSWNSEDLVIDEDSSVQALKSDDVDFVKTDLPTTITVSVIKSLCIGQLVSFKAKMLDMSDPTEVQAGKANLKMVEALIADPTGSIKLVVWEDLITTLEKGKTYIFERVRVKKDLKQDIYVNTAKNGTTIKEAEDFAQPLPIPDQIPEVYTHKTVDGMIMGVQKVQCYFACCKCNKKVEVKESSKIAECRGCNLKQRKSSCSKQFYAHILFAYDNTRVSLTLFHNIITDIVKLSRNQNPDMAIDFGGDQEITEDTVTDAILYFDEVRITFNAKTKVLSKFSPL